MAARVLLTGASGFVGRNTIEPLLQRGYEVHAVGARPVDSRVRWYRANLLDPAMRRQLLGAVRPDALLHAAWVTTHGAFWTAPENVDWTAASLDLLRQAAMVGTSRVLMVGSCAEYDWSAPPERPWRETDPCKPGSVYGAAKHALHGLAAAFARSQGMVLVWPRLFHLFGPHEAPGRLVPSLLAALHAGMPAPTGPGRTIRDLLDVRDAGRALALLLQDAPAGPVNVGAGGGISIGEVARRIGAVTGRGDLLRIGARPRAAGEPVAIVADTSRLAGFGFVPQHRLDDTLSELFAALGGVPCPIPPAPQGPEKDPAYAQAARRFHQGDFAGAERCAQAVLEAQPAHAPALNLLGVLLRRRGRLAEAQALLERAAAADPEGETAWINLGNLFIELEQPERAAEFYARARSAEPDNAETIRLLGTALARAGRTADALVAFFAARAAGAQGVTADIARAQFASGDTKAALATLEGVQDPDLLCLRADMLRLSGETEAARGVLAGILARAPDHRAALLSMAEALLAVEAREAANAHYRRALALQPDDENVQGRLCWSLLNSRYGDEAAHIGEAAGIARAMAERGDLRPGSAHAVQSALMRVADFDGLACFDRQFPDRRALLDYWVRRNTIGALHAQLGRVVSPADRFELIACHRMWGETLQAKHAPLRPHRGARRDRLRIGFMSSDLRHHPVSYFALPIFEFHDPAQVELFCYSFYPGAADPVQARIASLVTRFDTLHWLPDEAVAARIAADSLDVLVELGGSTHLNRLEVMAFQPAPVQVSWLGYPHSAGLSRIGHIVVDPYLRPPDPRLLTEAPLEMPSSWVCLGGLGFADQPIDPDPPEARAGVLTFGTMNNPYKYTPACIAAWARVMQALPQSRFLFVRPEAGVPAFRDFVAAHFAAHGIARARLVFRAVRGDHMRHYNDIDISLDTMPQTGGTTTCECLWMGVPVVSLTGEAFFERLSTSNLVNARLGDLAVGSVDDYVARAIELARDRRRRYALRQSLRAQIKASPLGDQRGWVRDFAASIALIA
jgi:predicted O-linked N-acetylglucosamine transferase (SPINDLY family)/nucleoside-diphosphate-sugar epimerase